MRKYCLRGARDDEKETRDVEKGARVGGNGARDSG
jgi:hypothetical protein